MSLIQAPKGLNKHILLVDAHDEQKTSSGTHRQLLLAPLGLLHLNAGIRQFCPDVKSHILDWSTFSDENQEEDFVRVLQDFQPAIVGISAFSIFMPLAIKIANIVREFNSDIPIVLGGDHPTTFPGGIVNFSMFDYYVIGKGVHIFPKLIRFLFDGSPAREKIPSISYREGGILVQNDIQQGPSPNEALPIDWGDIDLESYWHSNIISTFSSRVSLKYNNGPPFPYIASEGCPFSCRFCERYARSPLRHRSPEKICQDLRKYTEKIDSNSVLFFDNLPNINRRWFMSLLDIIRKNLDIQFACMVRADYLDREMIQRMGESGAYLIGCFPESGSSRIRQDMNKTLKMDKFLSNIQYASEQGIIISASFLFGWPGETLEDAEETLTLSQESFFDFVTFSPLIYFGGSQIGTHLEDFGIKPDTDEYFQHIRDPTSVCLADYSVDEYRKILKRGESVSASKIENKKTLEKIESFNLDLVLIEGGDENGDETIEEVDTGRDIRRRALLTILNSDLYTIEKLHLNDKDQSHFFEVDVSNSHTSIKISIAKFSENYFAKTNLFSISHHGTEISEDQRQIISHFHSHFVAVEHFVEKVFQSIR